MKWIYLLVFFGVLAGSILVVFSKRKSDNGIPYGLLLIFLGLELIPSLNPISTWFIPASVSAFILQTLIMGFKWEKRTLLLFIPGILATFLDLFTPNLISEEALSFLNFEIPIYIATTQTIFLMGFLIYSFDKIKVKKSPKLFRYWNMIGGVNLVIFILLMGKIMFLVTKNSIYFNQEVLMYIVLVIVGYLGIFNSRIIQKPYRLQSTYMYRKLLKTLKKGRKKEENIKKEAPIKSLY